MEQANKIEISYPKKLYRFIKYDRLCEIVSLSRFFMPSPDSFNDPFDCRVLLDGGNQDRQRNVQQELDNLGRVLCFSARRPEENPLMWAHYADGHKGVCLEFDMRSWMAHLKLVPDENGALKAVEYNSNRSKVDLNDASVERLYEIVYRKHKHWKYEKEWRLFMVLQENKPHYVGFPRTALMKVYLGLKMPASNRTTLYECVRRAGYENTKIMAASENEARFGLAFHSFRPT